MSHHEHVIESMIYFWLLREEQLLHAEKESEEQYTLSTIEARQKRLDSQDNSHAIH